MRYGYIRVSSKGQRIDRQLTAMQEIGLASSQLYIDASSGKDFNRDGYRQLLEKLSWGDEVVIKSIDRLGRNYEEILEQWRLLVKEKGIAIEVLDFPLLNTKNHLDHLTGQLISDLFLQILSYVAQLEREQIRQRQSEGIREAKRKGIRLGRPPLPQPEQFEPLFLLYQRGELSIREGAKILNISKSTFYNWIKMRGSVH